MGDFNADGFPDLFVANYGRNTLYRNCGDGTFEDVSDRLRMSPDGTDLSNVWSTSAAWFDVENDGDLDLYVVNYLDVTPATHAVCQQDGKPVYCGPGKYDAVRDAVFVNQGDGHFVEAADSLGFNRPGGRGMAVCVVDLDQDGRPEVYVANDMTANFLFTRSDSLTSPNTLYREVAELCGCAASRSGQTEASMGIACADFDGDTRVDLLITHYYQEKNTLYQNRGGLLFDDESRSTRIAATSYESLGFGTCVLDFNRDGFQDVMISNGHVLGPNHIPNEMKPQLLQNTGQASFQDVSKHAGNYFSDEWLGRGLASCDFDNDGDSDFVVTHLERPTALLRNDTVAPGSFIQIQLLTNSRVAPVGGRIRLSADGHQQVIPIVAGGSYLCSNDHRVLIGIPDQVVAADIDVTWPDGKVSRLHLTKEQFNRRLLWADWLEAGPLESN
ncbi:MAG: CRTAC1 family protein [Planctomycetota bacterium]|nr:CRTAC1 family protein [Planctomycetota bacterium]